MQMGWFGAALPARSGPTNFGGEWEQLMPSRGQHVSQERGRAKGGQNGEMRTPICVNLCSLVSSAQNVYLQVFRRDCVTRRVCNPSSLCGLCSTPVPST
ncbi:unnamed protein product, partial [Protopolystoma xenopodis]